MKQAEQELHEGAKLLECTTYGVLHERHLEAFIAPQHWDSLMNGLVREVPFFSVKQSQHTLTALSADESEVPQELFFLASLGYQESEGANSKLCKRQ